MLKTSTDAGQAEAPHKKRGVDDRAEHAIPGRGADHSKSGSLFGCWSKIGTQNGTLVNGTLVNGTKH